MFPCRTLYIIIIIIIDTGQRLATGWEAKCRSSSPGGGKILSATRHPERF
jgi:hypothetical protein